MSKLDPNPVKNTKKVCKIRKPKACPFCGWNGDKSIYITDQLCTIEIEGFWYTGWAVTCPNCGATGPVSLEDDAQKRWNKRVKI